MKDVSWAKTNWGIRDLEPVYETSKRAVYRGYSETRGAVVLKWNENHGGLEGEYRALTEMSGCGVCRVYDYIGERGLLLLEHVMPGICLREECDPQKRLEGFFQVFETIHLPLSEMSGDPAEYPTYLDWLEKADDYCASHSVPEAIGKNMHRALRIGGAMFAKYPDRVFLHGDLHHDNMLLSSAGTYRAIDPKGVVGPAVFDLPRYLLNEVDSTEECPARLQGIIGGMAKHMGIPAEDIGQLLFMETALEIAWDVEDGGEPDQKVMEQVDRLLAGAAG